MLRWVWCGYNKKSAKTSYVELVFLHQVRSVCQVVHPGRETSRHYFLCSGGPVAVPTKEASGHIMMNLCFCIQRDWRVTYCILVCLGHEMLMHYFHARVGLVRIPQKMHRETLHRTCVFAFAAICGHVMHSGASGVQNVDTIFSFSSGLGADITKSASEHITSNLCFCIPCDL
jgi:hypothetical protein